MTPETTAAAHPAIRSAASSARPAVAWQGWLLRWLGLTVVMLGGLVAGGLLTPNPQGWLVCSIAAGVCWVAGSLALALTWPSGHPIFVLLATGCRFGLPAAVLIAHQLMGAPWQSFPLALASYFLLMLPTEVALALTSPAAQSGLRELVLPRTTNAAAHARAASTQPATNKTI